MSWIGRRLKAWFGDKKKTDTQTSRNTYDKWVTDHSQDLAGRARREGQRGYQAYQGPIATQYSPELNMAGGRLGQMAPVDRGYLQGQRFDPTTAQGFIDQYIQASQPGLQDVAEQANMRRNAVRSSGAAAWGDRGYLAESEIDRNEDRARQGYLSDAIGRGIGMGFQAHESDIANRQRAQQLALNADNSYIANALNIGGQRTAIDEGNIARALGLHQYESDQPLRRLAMEQGILAGLPKNTTGTQSRTYTQANPLLGNLIGGGATIAGAMMGMPAIGGSSGWIAKKFNVGDFANTAGAAAGAAG